MKFHENPSSVRRVVPCGRTGRRTDKHDEADTRFSQFCEKRLNIKKKSQLKPKTNPTERGEN